MHLSAKKRGKGVPLFWWICFYVKSCLFYVFILQILETKQPAVPKIDSPEGYYEEAEPYDISVNGISQLTLGRGSVWEMGDLRFMRITK